MRLGSVEAGGSVGGSIGRGIGRGIGEGAISSSFVSEGPARGFTSLPSLGFDLSRAVPPVFTNDVAVKGPKGGLEKENTMPYKVVINNLGNYAIEPIRQPEIFPAAEAILEVESILAKARVVSPVPDVFQSAFNVNLDPDAKPATNLIAEITPSWVNIEEDVHRESRRAQFLLGLVAARALSPISFQIAAAVTPKPEVNQATIAQAEPEVGLQAGTYLKAEPNLVYIQPQKTEVPIVEIAQEEEFEEAEEERKIEEPEEEEVAELTLSHSVDKETFKKRVDKVEEAGAEVIAEANPDLAEHPIPGWKIVKRLLSLSMRAFRGQDIEELDPEGTLPDGTWEANLEKIAKETFASKKDLSNKTPRIIALDNPVAKGAGEEVTDGNMLTTYKHDITKAHPVHQVIKRVFRIGELRAVPISTEQRTPKAEKSLKDLGLTEVFQKAA